MAGGDDFGKTLVISLVVGIISVVVIGGLILWFALGWHRLFNVKPRDRTAEQWDVESAQRKSSSTIWHKRSSSSGSWSSKSSFFSSKNAGDPLISEKAKQWPSPTGSRTSSGETVAASPPAWGTEERPQMARAVLR